MSKRHRAFIEAVAAAIVAYVLAGGLEAGLIRWLQPTELELAWVSDVALALALGVAVYLWRHLLITRHELAERERGEIVLQTQLSIAAEIQRRLLPRLPAPSDEAEWAAALKSAGQIGGDFYDIVETSPGRWVALVADVSGKGIPAAMVLGSLRSTFRTLARQRLEPARILCDLSAALLQEFEGMPYVTCIVAALDLSARTIVYSNGGHPPGLLAGRGRVRLLDRGGPPVGLIANAAFDQQVLHVHAGDVCLLVSDGVTESLDGVPLERYFHLWDIERASAAGLCQAVMASALRGRGPAGDDRWDDDRTVVVVRVGPAEALMNAS